MQPVGEAIAAGLAYSLGVHPEAPDALGRLHGDHAHAPYLPRSVDPELRERMASAAAADRATLVLLSGPSKAGKSRTLMEALGAVLADAPLLAPVDPVALAILADQEPPVPRSGPLVVWLDDVEPYVTFGADSAEMPMLTAIGGWGRPVVVAATVGGMGLDVDQLRTSRLGHALEAPLARHAPVRLALRHTEAAEIETLRNHPTYWPISHELEEQGIGRFMIAAPRLERRLENARRGRAMAQLAEGWAVLQTAIDWRLIGMRRPIGKGELADLYQTYLPKAPAPERLRFGIEWATLPVYESVALLSESAWARGTYVPHDYIVEHARRTQLWADATAARRVVEAYADADDLLLIGAIADAGGDAAVAEVAWARAEEIGSAIAGLQLAALLLDRGDGEGARAAYERAAERGSGRASLELGRLLERAGDHAGAEAAYRHADARRIAVPELGDMLRRSGDPRSAEAVYARADERGSARGAYCLGRLLDDRGAVREAEAAYRRAGERGHARAAANLGLMLETRGELAAAEEAYRRADELGHPNATYRLALLLARRGDPDGAQAAYARADDRGHADAAHELGVLLEGRGDLRGAEAAYRRADERGSADAALKLAAVLTKRGDVDGARDAFARAQRRLA